MSYRGCIQWAVAAAVVAFAGAPALAEADSLVFVKAGRVQVARADGSQARPVSPQGHWTWPSESDNGKIAAMPTEDYKLYEFDQQGRSLLSSPMFTPATTYNQNAVYYVDHTRIAPDGSRVAYNVVGCCGFSGKATFLQPMSAGNSNWGDFQDDYINPVWVDASTANDPYVNAKNGLGLGHNGYQWLSGCCQYGIWNADNSSVNGGWESDSAIPSSDWEFEVAYTRNLKHLALFLDDSPAYGGTTAHHVRIVLESVDWANQATTTDDCTIPLAASSYSHNPQDSDSISYSSDGSTLTWANDNGIYEANVSSPSNCTAVKSSVHLAVAGGAYPYFGAAALSPVTPPPNTTIISAAVKPAVRTATFGFRGTGGVGRLTFRCRLDSGSWAKCASPVTYTHLARGSHTFAVKAIDSRGKADRTPAVRHFTI